MGKRSKNKVSDYTLLTFAHVIFGFITRVQLLNKQYNFSSNDRKAMVSFNPGESDMNDKVALSEEVKNPSSPNRNRTYVTDWINIFLNFPNIRPFFYSTSLEMVCCMWPNMEKTLIVKVETA